jgi:hypothetical protein
MTVYDALEKRHVMPRAWDDWAEYRKNWSNQIIRHCEEDGSLLILGAGACNDYDLERFSRFFHEILLLDSDVKSMEEAKKRLPEASRGMVRIEQVDLLGIEPAEYEEFCQRIQARVNRKGKLTDIQELAELALELIEEMYKKAGERREALFFPQADYVAISGVHSQVNHMLPWIWEAYMQVLGQREARVFARISEENDRVIAWLDERLLAAAGRRLFVSAEASRAGVPGAVQGAYQALCDFKSKKGLTVLDDKKLMWSYDLRQPLIYEMETLVLERQQDKE